VRSARARTAQACAESPPKRGAEARRRQLEARFSRAAEEYKRAAADLGAASAAEPAASWSGEDRLRPPVVSRPGSAGAVGPRWR
jgi:hypothetical protein